MEKLSLPAELGALSELRRYTKEAAAQAGVDADRSYQLQLAIDEIATNIISYGYTGDGAKGDITIGGEMRDGALVITLEDHGPAFDPRTRPIPRAEEMDRPLEERKLGGLGIYLALHGVDRFDYRREGDRNLNIFEVRTGSARRWRAHLRLPRLELETIRSRILIALLALSLLPLVLVVIVSRWSMADVRARVRTELVADAERNLGQLAADQAASADAILNKVEAETNAAAAAAQLVLRNGSALAPHRVYSRAQRPPDSATVLVYDVAAGVASEAARSELGRFGNLEEVFARTRSGDPNLDAIYLGTHTGLMLTTPRDQSEQDPLEFILARSYEPQLKSGVISAQLRDAFQQHGIALSPHTRVSTVTPRTKWLVSDATTRLVFTARRVDDRLEVHWEFDPRLRDWYLDAVGRGGAVWTMYASWNGGQLLFSLGDAQKYRIGDRVTRDLAQSFATGRVILREGSPIEKKLRAAWKLQDRNGKNYEIWEEDGRLNVYATDILTCSRAILAQDASVAGVVGLDINMTALSRRIMHANEQAPGDAFLLNERGELVEQERSDMVVADTASGVRRTMTLGRAGIAFDSAAAVFFAYAPIRSIRSPDGKTYWSLGISMPQREILDLADQVEGRMSILLRVLLFLLAAMIPVVAFTAFRVAGGITQPIRELDQGARRLGDGDLDYRLAVTRSDEVGELSDTFNRMARDLQTRIRELRETTAAKERLEGELKVARDIQMSFLKKLFPAFPDRRDFSLFATIEPAREVGGDLYDFALLDQRHLVLCIGDVSDKGVPAALVMAETMTLMRQAAKQPGITAAGILRQVNAALAEGNETAMFVTMFIGILDVCTGELTYSNAGHNPPLLVGADGQCRFLTLPEGLVLGAMTESEYRDATTRLESGDALLAYTDGVTEAMSPDHVLYSEARLQATAARLVGRDVENTVAAVVASVHEHAAAAPQSDDIAVIALRRS